MFTRITMPIRILSTFLFSVLMLTAFQVMAQATDLPVVPDAEFFSYLIQSLGGLSGASTLAIVGIVVQVLIKLMSTPMLGKLFTTLSGAWKLTIVSVLSLAGGVVTLMTANGLTIGAALMHSATLTAFMVLFNQVYKQFFAPAPPVS